MDAGRPFTPPVPGHVGLWRRRPARRSVLEVLPASLVPASWVSCSSRHVSRAWSQWQSLERVAVQACAAFSSGETPGGKSRRFCLPRLLLHTWASVAPVRLPSSLVSTSHLGQTSGPLRFCPAPFSAELEAVPGRSVLCVLRGKDFLSTV